MPDIARRNLATLRKTSKRQLSALIGLGVLVSVLGVVLLQTASQQLKYQQHVEKISGLVALNAALLTEVGERSRLICCRDAPNHQSIRTLENQTNRLFEEVLFATQEDHGFYAQTTLERQWSGYQSLRLKPLSCSDPSACQAYQQALYKSLATFLEDLQNRFAMQQILMPQASPVVSESLILLQQVLEWHAVSQQLMVASSIYQRFQTAYWRDRIVGLQAENQQIIQRISDLQEGFDQVAMVGILAQVNLTVQADQTLQAQFVEPVRSQQQTDLGWWQMDQQDSRLTPRKLIAQIASIEQGLFALFAQHQQQSLYGLFALLAAWVGLVVGFLIGLRKFFAQLDERAFIPAASRQAVLEESQYGLLEFDAAGQIHYVNAHAQNTLNLSKEAMNQTPVYAYFDLLKNAYDQQEFEAFLDAWLQTRTEYKAAQLHSSQNKQAIPVRLNLGHYNIDNQERYFLSFIDDRETQQNNQLLTQQTLLFSALKNATADFVDSKSPEAVWDDLLSSLLKITQSEYGFIGEVVKDPDSQQPCLKIHALTDIAWDAKATELFEQLKSQDMLLCNGETLIGRAMVTQEYVISNDVPNDPRGGHLPPGHPDLNKYLGVPIFRGNELVGVYGLANREAGYSKGLVDFLEPFNATCGVLIAGLREKNQRAQLLDYLKIAKAEAEATTAMKSEFLANMSHEIRTPMNGILGMAYLAMKSGLNATQKDYVNKIHRSANHLLNVINDILDFSKIESGKIELEQIALQIEEVVEDAMLPVQSMAQKKQLELLVHIDKPLSYCAQPSLKGDAVRIAQILINLIGNAVKFTETGHVEINVDIERFEQTTCWVRFEVKDTGIGMTPEEQGKLFQAFSQADATVNRKFGGTGLGLVISKQLAQTMGGDIRFSSVKHQGSNFSLVLPLETPANRVESKCPSWDTRIIVIDDNSVANMQMKKMMQSFGIECECFQDAQSFYDKAQTTDLSAIEWVFIDWIMPEHDGVEVVQWLREHAPNLARKSVLMSFYDSERLDEIARQHRIAHTLTKPVLPTHLAALLNPEDVRLRRHRKLTVDEDQKIPDLNNKTILLVEDNRLNQQIAQELLAMTGATVWVAENGEMAVQQLQNAQHEFDLVLMDLQMPVMGGLEATQLIRKQPALQAIPILAMTAHAFSEEIERCQAAGMNDHISKPIIPETLYAKLTKYLSPNRFVASSVETLPAGESAAQPPSEQEMPHLTNKVSIEEPVSEQTVQIYQSLVALPGVELMQAKALMPPTPGFFEKMLVDFVHEYAQAPQELESLLDATVLDAQTLEPAIRYCHTMKGLSASFGLNAISVPLERFEDQMLTQEQAPDAQSLLEFAAIHQTLWEPLQAYAEALLADGIVPNKRHTAAVEPAADATSTLSATGSLSAEQLEVQQMFNQMCGDFDAELEAYWQQQQPLFAGVLSPEILQQIGQYLEEFEFEEAQNLLNQRLEEFKKL